MLLGHIQIRGSQYCFDLSGARSCQSLSIEGVKSRVINHGGIRGGAGLKFRELPKRIIGQTKRTLVDRAHGQCVIRMGDHHIRAKGGGRHHGDTHVNPNRTEGRLDDLQQV